MYTYVYLYLCIYIYGQMMISNTHTHDPHCVQYDASAPRSPQLITGAVLSIRTRKHSRGGP